MPKSFKERKRDDRDFDTTSLHVNSHGKRFLHRDYSGHFWRWSFSRRLIKRADHVLDVGCGPEIPLGNILAGTVHPFMETYTGVDLNPLRATKNKRWRLEGEFNFVERWRELKRDGGYDVATTFEVIEHMLPAHGHKFLAGIFALLKPGGRMLISTPCYDGVHHAANHIHEWTVPELREAIEGAGFEVEARYGTFMDVKYIGKADIGDADLSNAVGRTAKALGAYFDNEALSCLFAPLYPDYARNNIWVCRKAP